MAAIMASRSIVENFKIGAVLVKSGNAVSFGLNSYYRTNKIATRYFSKAPTYPSIHAECDVLHKAGGKAHRGSTIYLVRLTKTGFGSSRPCPTCMQMLKDYGVRKVVYSVASYPFFMEEKV